MSNSNDELTIVNGFAFPDAAQAQKARKEARGVAYMKEKTEPDNPQMILQIYNKMVEQKLFETVVGYTYLKELQDYLMTVPDMKPEDIYPIPVQQVVAAEENGRNGSAGENPDSAGKDGADQNGTVPPAVQQDSGDKKVLQRLKLRAGIATGISIALAVCVIGMFAIQMTTGSVNILNYENEIINKYEKWEQELSEREAAVRELELENGISGQGEDRED